MPALGGRQTPEPGWPGRRGACHAAHSRPFRGRGGSSQCRGDHPGRLDSIPAQAGPSPLNGPSLPRRTGPLPWSGRLLTRGETLPSGRSGLGETGETGNPFTRLCRGGRGWEEGGGNGLLLQVGFVPGGAGAAGVPGQPRAGPVRGDPGAEKVLDGSLHPEFIFSPEAKAWQFGGTCLYFCGTMRTRTLSGPPFPHFSGGEAPCPLLLPVLM